MIDIIIYFRIFKVQSFLQFSTVNLKVKQIKADLESLDLLVSYYSDF